MKTRLFTLARASQYMYCTILKIFITTILNNKNKTQRNCKDNVQLCYA